MALDAVSSGSESVSVRINPDELGRSLSLRAEARVLFFVWEVL
jgi:hypothetical protein